MNSDVKRRMLGLWAALLLALALLPPGVGAQGRGAGPTQGNDSPQAPVIPAPERAVPGQYIVALQEGSNPRSVAAVAGVSPRYVYTTALNGFAANLNAGQLTALQRNRDVRYIEEDAEVSVSVNQSPATWGLDRIDQRSLPLNNTYTYTNTGAGVRAYIIDTGIRLTHVEFGGRAISGFDAIDGGSADDCNGHGTHVAGTVGGSTYGVAKSVTLVAVRVLGCNGSGTWSQVIAGIDFATADHMTKGGSSVANMSLSGSGNTSVDSAVRRSIAAGISYTVAAGNGNIVGIAQDACKYSPARVSEAITVSATNKTDSKTSWANYGKCVDLFAPGDAIESAVNDGDTAIGTKSGTSMAAPHAAGVAALFLQSNPGATPTQVQAELVNQGTPNVVKNAKTSNPRLLYTSY